jgi:hypothetical protein
VKHRTTTAILACSALTLAIALTACSGHPQPTAKSPASSSAASPNTPGAAPEPTGSAKAETTKAGTAEPHSGTTSGKHPRTVQSGLPPKPDTNGEAAYVRALTAIDPDIVHDSEDQAVTRGREECRTIHDLHGNRAGQVAAAVKLFTSPGHPQGFGTVKGGRIVDAVHSNLCPDF